jgi:hypothetical protein
MPKGSGGISNELLVYALLLGRSAHGCYAPAVSGTLNLVPFAREFVVQVLGIALLAERSVRRLTASSDDLTDSHDLGHKTMRRIADAFMEYENGPGRQIAQRQRKETGKKVGDRKSTLSYGQTSQQKRVALGGQRAKPGVSSYRQISGRLKDARLMH